MTTISELIYEGTAVVTLSLDGGVYTVTNLISSDTRTNLAEALGLYQDTCSFALGGAINAELEVVRFNP